MKFELSENTKNKIMLHHYSKLMDSYEDNTQIGFVMVDAIMAAAYGKDYDNHKEDIWQTYDFNKEGEHGINQ